MSESNFYQTEITAQNGASVRLVYDQEADKLEIFFGENLPATGVELTDHILLRYNKAMSRAICILLLNFSDLD